MQQTLSDVPELASTCRSLCLPSPEAQPRSNSAGHLHDRYKEIFPSTGLPLRVPAGTGTQGMLSSQGSVAEQCACHFLQHSQCRASRMKWPSSPPLQFLRACGVLPLLSLAACPVWALSNICQSLQHRLMSCHSCIGLSISLPGALRHLHQHCHRAFRLHKRLSADLLQLLFASGGCSLGRRRAAERLACWQAVDKPLVHRPELLSLQRLGAGCLLCCDGGQLPAHPFMPDSSVK